MALRADDLTVTHDDRAPRDGRHRPAAQRPSLAFANNIATLRQRTGGAITVEIENAGRSDPLAYPEQGEGSTAGEWNLVAAQNNRVEFRLEPAE